MRSDAGACHTGLCKGPLDLPGACARFQRGALRSCVKSRLLRRNLDGLHLGSRCGREASLGRRRCFVDGTTVLDVCRSRQRPVLLRADGPPALLVSSVATQVRVIPVAVFVVPVFADALATVLVAVAMVFATDGPPQLVVARRYPVTSMVTVTVTVTVTPIVMAVYRHPGLSFPQRGRVCPPISACAPRRSTGNWVTCRAHG